MPSCVPAILLLANVAFWGSLFFMFSAEPPLKSHYVMGYLGLLGVFIGVELSWLRKRLVRLEEKTREPQ